MLKQVLISLILTHYSFQKILSKGLGMSLNPEEYQRYREPVKSAQIIDVLLVQYAHIPEAKNNFRRIVSAFTPKCLIYCSIFL